MRAHGWLLVLRIALRFVPFRTIRAWMQRTTLIATRGRGVDARAVRRAVQRAARTFPETTCLARALTAEKLLRSAGLPARLSIGVAAPTPSDGTEASAARRERYPLDAHAWIHSDHLLVAGDGELERYHTLAQFGAS